MSNRLIIFLNKLRLAKQVLLSKTNLPEPGQLFDCPVCGAHKVVMHPMPIHHFIQWQKYQTIHNPFFIETMHIEHHMCSNCHAFDRDRLYALYINQYLKKVNHTINLLDIAPDKSLRTMLRKSPQINYRSMDLMMEDVDDHLDITNMNAYQNEQYDFFICSHVLEHIPDDIAAMKELYRILKNDGKGIVMVPLNLELKETTEDVTCTDTAMRWKYFFQDDHIRMYSKSDFINRLTSVGFRVEQLDKNYFGKDIFQRNAIFLTSVLYVVSKN